MPNLKLSALNNPTIFLAIGLMGIIIMMTLPVPSWVLDAGLTMSFAFAILIFTLTLFIERPLDFSSFPAVLLASLLLRLSLNVASTKLIIGQGHTGIDAAGGVIAGFAMFVMGGNVFMGLIVFCVLVIVNFMVITKGAGRMAEVGARFALDAMPGKQMAIDADLAAGAISHEEASRRRLLEQEETAFLGSLDGVSKFMKGDAVAGILITLLNLIAGIAIGIGVHKIGFGEAIKNYSILTVGDGLVSQIPAVIISIAAGLLLSKGKGEGTFDFALGRQFMQHPSALMAVSAIMLIFAFFPGLPFFPFLVGALLLGWAAYSSFKRAAKETDEDATKTETSEETPEKPLLGDALDIDEIHIELSKELVAVTMEAEFGFDQRVEKIRRYIATEFGFILPAIRLTDNAQLESQSYRINIQGVEIAKNTLKPFHVLAIMEPKDFPEIVGENTQEPVYNAPARWVLKEHQDELIMLGIPTVEVTEVLATHLLEVVQANFTKLLTRRSLRETLETFKTVSDPERAESNKKILEEFLPDKVPLETLQGVLRLLLDERISIRNLPVVLETIAEAKSAGAQLEQIADFVRLRLSYQFIGKLRDAQGRVPIVQIGPKWEATFGEYEVSDDAGRKDVALPPGTFNDLAKAIKDKLDQGAAQGHYAAIATSQKRRRFIKTVMAAKNIRNPVIAYEEIMTNERPAIVGVA